MKLAKSNTVKNLETCGVLAGSLVSADKDYFLWSKHFLTLTFLNTSFLQKNRKFYVTALIIPKQESTSDSVWRFLYTFYRVLLCDLIRYILPLF